MRIWVHCAAGVSLIVLASAVHGQLPARYRIGSVIALPDTVNEVWSGGRFRMTVHRTAHTETERRLIAVAERLVPDTGAIVSAARDARQRAQLDSASQGAFPAAYRGPPRGAGNPAERWWFTAFDATWLPFALTSGAVHYYIGRFRDLAAGHNQFGAPPGDTTQRGRFIYSANVRPTRHAGAAYVVELEITWEYYCGMLCALTFHHRRSVWFDDRGNVVRITGDGPPVAVVS